MGKEKTEVKMCCDKEMIHSETYFNGTETESFTCLECGGFTTITNGQLDEEEIEYLIEQQKQKNEETLNIKGQMILILTEKQVLEQGKEKDEFHKKNNTEIYSPEHYEKLKKESMPYKLFRLNELCQHNLNFVGVEITEEQANDRLGQLPPISFKYDNYEGYIVNECITENRFEHIFEHKNKFYCVIMDLQKNERQ